MIDFQNKTDYNLKIKRITQYKKFHNEIKI